MDFYADFMKTLGETDTPAATLKHLRELVLEATQTAPARVALLEGCSFLAVLHDSQNLAGVKLTPIFNEVKMEIETLLSILSTDIGLEDELLEMEVRKDAKSDS